MSTKLIIKKAKPVLEKFGVRKAALFGSYATGKTTKTSDVDILLELKKDLSLFDVLKLKYGLEKKLGRKVDLVEFKSIKPNIRRSVLRHRVPLL